MPFSSARSLRAPASNATSTVRARVPPSATVDTGNPFSGTVLVWIVVIGPQ